MTNKFLKKTVIGSLIGTAYAVGGVAQAETIPYAVELIIIAIISATAAIISEW